MVSRPTKNTKPKPSFRAFVNFNFTSRHISMNFVGLMDTGASCSLIAKNQLNTDFAKIVTPGPSSVRGIGGTQKILGSLSGKVKIGEAFFQKVEFLVVEELPKGAQVILGTNVILHPHISTFAINTAANEIQFRFRSRNLNDTIRSCKYMKDAKYSDNEVKCQEAQTNDNKNTFKNLRDKLEYLSKEKEITLYHANENYLEKFANMLLDNLSVFGKEGELGCFPTPVAIETQGDPINIRPHAIAQKYEPFVDAEIEKMKKAGVIRKCKDPKGWNSPI